VAKGNASNAAGQDQQIHAALLLFFVMCNIPFRVVPTAVRQLASWPVLRRLLLRRCQT